MVLHPVEELVDQASTALSPRLPTERPTDRRPALPLGAAGPARPGRVPRGRPGSAKPSAAVAPERRDSRAVRPRESQVRAQCRLSDAGGGARGPPRSISAGEGSRRLSSRARTRPLCSPAGLGSRARRAPEAHPRGTAVETLAGCPRSGGRDLYPPRNNIKVHTHRELDTPMSATRPPALTWTTSAGASKPSEHTDQPTETTAAAQRERHLVGPRLEPAERELAGAVGEGDIAVPRLDRHAAQDEARRLPGPCRW